MFRMVIDSVSVDFWSIASGKSRSHSGTTRQIQPSPFSYCSFFLCFLPSSRHTVGGGLERFFPHAPCDGETKFPPLFPTRSPLLERTRKPPTVSAAATKDACPKWAYRMVVRGSLSPLCFLTSEGELAEETDERRRGMRCSPDKMLRVKH